MKLPLSRLFLGLSLVLTSLAWGQRATTKRIPLSLGDIEVRGHTFLLAAVKAANLEAVLLEAGPFTVFAPSDAAFHTFANGRMEELLQAEDKRGLKALISYHIVAGELTASDILRALSRGNGKASLTTVQGKKLGVHMEGSDIVLTDPMGNTAKITAADLRLDHGVVHEIDRVILPAQM